MTDIARKLVAGVDSSTQSCKLLIVDAHTGEIVRSGRASHPDGTEVDPESWWIALGAAIEDAGGLADVGAISIGGQQHGMIILDSAGHIIRDALLWNDTRSADAARDLTDEVGAEAYARRVGLVPVASFTAAKLRWLRNAEPENAARVAAVALPHDWLTWRLRGYGPADASTLGADLDALFTDASDASGTAYWDPASRTYDDGLFETALGRRLRVAGGDIMDTDAVVVPRVIGIGEQGGVVAVDVAAPGGATIPAGLVIASGAGDNAAAALGLGAVPGDVVVSIGTSGTVFGVTDGAVVDPSGTIAGFSDASGARLPIATTLNAARVLDLVATLLDTDHDGLAQLALQALPGSAGAVLVPYFAGERTPDLPYATASFTGLTTSNTRRANIARCAIEGMLCSLADGVDALQAVTGRSAHRIVLIGGAARNDAVRAVAQTVFHAPIDVPPPGEYVALGAAIQASWLITGDRPFWDLAGSIRLEVSPIQGVRSAYAAAARQTATGSAGNRSSVERMTGIEQRH